MQPVVTARYAHAELLDAVKRPVTGDLGASGGGLGCDVLTSMVIQRSRLLTASDSAV
jgi:hypothetical protein